MWDVRKALIKIRNLMLRIFTEMLALDGEFPSFYGDIFTRRLNYVCPF